jgi:hypothetical protein
VRPPVYTAGVAQLDKQLFSAGVPATQITMGGHSKGGMMTLIASSQIQNPKVNFVNLAGCGVGPQFGRRFRRVAQRIGPQIQGRFFLSMYDAEDEISGSYDAAISQASHTEFREIVLKTGEGHGLFYTPQAFWIDRVAKWAQGQDVSE